MTATSENMAEALPDVEPVAERRDCGNFRKIIVGVSQDEADSQSEPRPPISCRRHGHRRQLG